MLRPSSQLSLCQEVVSSLKILFDFTVFSNLLYDKERNQYGRLLKRKIPSSLLPVSLSVSSEHSASSKTSSKAAARREHCLPVTKAEVSSATGCPVSDSSYVNRQPAAGGLDAPVSGTESVRSNISYLSAEHSYSRSPEFLVISEAARVLEETELSRKNGTHSSKSRPQDGATILNGTSRINGNSSPCQKAAESKADGNQPRRTRSKSHSLSVKPEPDIDAPIPCVHVTAPPSKTSAGRSSTSGGRASGMPAYCLDAASNVSRHAINFSVRPSDVYGATHLLRLFGKLLHTNLITILILACFAVASLDVLRNTSRWNLCIPRGRPLCPVYVISKWRMQNSQGSHISIPIIIIIIMTYASCVRHLAQWV